MARSPCPGMAANSSQSTFVAGLTGAGMSPILDVITKAVGSPFFESDLKSNVGDTPGAPVGLLTKKWWPRTIGCLAATVSVAAWTASPEFFLESDWISLKKQEASNKVATAPIDLKICSERTRRTTKAG